MTVTSATRSLVPDADERRRSLVWLLPWTTGRRWWAQPLGLGAGLLVLRAVLLVVTRRPIFMNDSVEYVALVDDLYVPRVRPPGVAVLWRLALAGWPSLNAILIAQSVAGVAAGVVLYFIAREIGLRCPAALLVAAIASLTPSVLFFERVLLAESFAVVLLVCASWLVLVGLRTNVAAPWMLAGFVGAAAVLVRTAALPTLLVTAVLAALATRGSVLRRAGAALAFGLALIVPLAGYGFATYVDTRAITGEGHFGLQFTDGFAYFSATAPLTDCSDPQEPPAIRARICAIPGYLDRDPDGISWGDGPVNDALDGRRWIQRNEDLKGLAAENVRRDPVGALRLAGGRAVRLLSTYDNQYFTDGAPLAPQLEALDLPVPERSGPTERAWGAVMDVWAVARWLLWIGMLVGLTLVPRRWARGGRELLMILLPAVVTMVWFAWTITAVSRYLFPFEWVGVLAVGWSAQVALDAWRPTSGSATPTAPALMED